MEVILLNDVDKLGFSEEIVKVKPGYARNFLIPRGFAVVKNETNLKLLAESIKRREKVEAKELANLQEIVDKLKTTSLQLPAKVGNSNRIFGSISAVQISDAFIAQGVKVDRRKISVKEGDIKELGTYTAVVALTKEVTIEVPLEIISE